MKRSRLIFWVTCTAVAGYLLVNGLSEKKAVTIGFAGDVMLGRLVNKSITTDGYLYPWGDTLSILKKNDFNVINLETTLTKSEKRVFKVFNYKSDPDNIQSLIEANISLVNLANNHILDFNEEGMLETLKTLADKKIKSVGVGQDIALAGKVEILEKNGIKIGVIGYTDNEPSWAATNDKAGTNYVKVGQIEKIAAQVKSIRDQVDILIISIHWGPNKIERPEKELVDFAHKIIDCGVDIIHGHSAHIFQGIEIYNGKVIMYGTGDFVDDYMIYPDLHNDHSFLFRIKITKESIQRVELVPVFISEMQVNLAKDDLAQKILKRMKKLSSELGTEIKIQDDIGFINIKK